MRSKILITIFVGLASLRILPGDANPIASQRSSVWQTYWEKCKSFFGNAEQTIESGSEQLVKNGGEKVKEVMEELIYEIKKVTSGISFHESKCQCRNYMCGCCFNLVVEKITLDHTGCLDIDYLPNEYGFEFTFTLDDKIVVDEKISVKNPPPICADIPFVYDLAGLCLRFYGNDDQIFPWCAALELDLEGVHVKSFEIGCIQSRAK